MFNKLNAVRLVPQGKEKNSKIVLGFLLSLLFGLIMGVSDWIIISAAWAITNSSVSIVAINQLFVCGLFAGIDLLILFFIAKNSRTPLFSSLHTLTFFIGLLLGTFFTYFSHSMLDFDVWKDAFTLKMIFIAACLVLFTVFNYFFWYATGKGKIADIFSIIAVAGMIVLNALPIYEITKITYLHSIRQADIPMDSFEIASIIAGIIAIVGFVAFAVIFALNLKNGATKRKKSLILSVPCGVLVGVGAYLIFAFTTPIAMNTYLF